MLEAKRKNRQLRGEVHEEAKRVAGEEVERERARGLRHLEWATAAAVAAEMARAAQAFAETVDAGADALHLGIDAQTGHTSG